MKRIATYILLLMAAIAMQAQINTEQVMRIGRNSLYFEDYVLSIQYFNQVIKAKPFLAEPYFYRSVAKINLEDYQGAEADATLAIERNPFIVDAYQVRGVARQNLRDFEGAIADYDKGLELMPEEKVFLMNRAVCQDELKLFDECLSGTGPPQPGPKGLDSRAAQPGAKHRAVEEQRQRLRHARRDRDAQPAGL